MGRILLDCEPICGLPWQISLAEQPWEREEVFRLRYEVFHQEQGHPVGRDGKDADRFDEWCDLLTLRNEAKGELIATYRLIPGPAAMTNGGFYSATEFDLTAMSPIADKIMEIGRVCVASAYRNGLAMQFLWYGLELALKHRGLSYLLGCGSFDIESAQQLNRVYSYTRKYCADPEYYCPVLPRCQPPTPLELVETSPEDEKLLPPLIRSYQRMGANICSPPAWDADFGSYDFLVMFRRHQTNDHCESFLARMRRQLQVASRRMASGSKSGSGETDAETAAAAGGAVSAPPTKG